MKTLLSSLLVLTTVVAVAGCGSGGSTTAPVPATTQTGPEASTVPGAKQGKGRGRPDAESAAAEKKRPTHGGGRAKTQDGPEPQSHADGVPPAQVKKAKAEALIQQIQELANEVPPGNIGKPGAGSKHGGAGKTRASGQPEAPEAEQVVEKLEQLVEGGSAGGVTGGGSSGGESVQAMIEKMIGQDAR
jgi:predicted small lipoprotein YifL